MEYDFKQVGQNPIIFNRRILFLKNGVRKLGKVCIHTLNNEDECSPKPIYKKINSKWTKHLDLRPNHVNLRHTRNKKPDNIGFSNDSLDNRNNGIKNRHDGSHM